MPIDSSIKTPSNSYLHAFCLYPDIKIDGQLEDEEIVLLLRAHPVTFIPWIASAIGMSILPLIGNIVLIRVLTLSELLFINTFWYCFIFSYVFFHVLSWLFNVGILTSKRVIDIDYTSVVNRHITATSLEEVADVSKNTTGFIRSMFQYGDVQVQTSGVTQNVEFLAVPQPSEVAIIINKLMN